MNNQCSIETLCLRCTIFQIFDFKNAVTLKTGLGVRQGHWKCHHAIQRIRLTSYWRSVVTMALSRVVSEIFNIEKCRDLEIGARGHARSLKVLLFDRLCMISLIVFFSKTHRFWDIRLQNNRVMGPSRSLEMSPCDRSHRTSHWLSIVTMALSRVVSEIFNVEKCRDLEIGVRGHSRSLKVVPFGRSCIPISDNNNLYSSNKWQT